jgi:hypothetical protein
MEIKVSRPLLIGNDELEERWGPILPIEALFWKQFM